MSKEKKTATNFTEKDCEALIGKLQSIEDELGRFFCNLTPEERQRILKMRDKTTAFVSKAIQYGKEFPEVIPKVVDVEQLERDFVQAQQLDKVLRKTEKLVECLSDARLVAAGQAFTMSLKVYHALRGASDMDVPGIKSAVDEMGKRFSNQGRNTNAGGGDMVNTVASVVTAPVENGQNSGADYEAKNN